MKHSGWKNGNCAERPFLSYLGKFLFIFLLIRGFLFVLPEAASAFNIEKTGYISGFKGNVSISSVYLESGENISHQEGHQALDENGRQEDKKIEQKIIEICQK